MEGKELMENAQKMREAAEKRMRLAREGLAILKKAKDDHEKAKKAELQAKMDEGCVCATHRVKIPLCDGASLGNNHSAWVSRREGQN